MLNMVVNSSRSSMIFNMLNPLPKISFPFTSTKYLPSSSIQRIVRMVQTGKAVCAIRCMNSDSRSDGRMSARFTQMNQLLQDAESRAANVNEPIPNVTLDHVTVNFARSGGPGGQNVNKVNTKVDMRFNVMAAHWLPLRVRERILLMEKNRINSDGELVISSTKTRTQKGNIDDALGKLQAIIDAAAYVPPPPSEEKKKKIRKLAAIDEQRRLQNKKLNSQKKATRRTKGSWD